MEILGKHFDGGEMQKPRTLRGVLSALFIAAISLGCSPASDAPFEPTLRKTEPLSFAFQQALQEDDGALYGQSIALDGQIGLVGDGYADIGLFNGGAGYAYFRTGNTWSPAEALVASDRLGTDRLGEVVALSGDTAILSAMGRDNGACYVFVRSGSTWTEQQMIAAADGQPEGVFGHALAIEGDTAFVGATDPSGHDVVYVFERSGSTWSESQKLIASDDVVGGGFGQTIAVSGDHALIGAYGMPIDGDPNQGAVYVFERQGATWTEVQRLTSSDAAAASSFGQGLAVDGNTAMIGALVQNAGTTYVYAKTGSTWSEVQKLTFDDGLPGNSIGQDVAVSGSIALVSYPSAQIGDNLAQGAVYLFAEQAGVWNLAQVIYNPTGVDSDHFGTSIGLDGGLALITQDSTPRIVFAVSLVGGACGAECTTGHCADGVCCDTPCDGSCDRCSEALGATADGFCTLVAPGEAGDPACAPQACTGEGATCAACELDEHCPADRYCDGTGNCQPRKLRGAVCDPAADCQVPGCRACETNHCVDGRCCETSCASSCNACAEDLSAEPDGTCAPIPAGEDPKGGCMADPEPNSCLADGNCDGTGNCRDFALRQTPCGDPVCSGDGVSRPMCSGDGLCEQELETCAPFACSASACADSCDGDQDCATGAYCSGGACAEKLSNGTECAEDRECASDHCVDGVCCNGACEGQCEGCAEVGTAGTCTPVLGEPRGERPACEPNFHCEGGLCVPPEGTSCSDSVTQRNPNGTSKPCGAYVCSGIACLTACTGSSDCAPGHACNPNRNSCESVAGEAPPEEGGCACQVERTGRSHPSLLLFLAAGIGASRLRRRPVRDRGTVVRR